MGSDDALGTFLENGYIVHYPEVDPSVHDQVLRELDEQTYVCSKIADSYYLDEFIADNFVARSRALQSVLADSRLSEILTDIVGEEFERDFHCFISQSRDYDQEFHKDSVFPVGVRNGLRFHHVESVSVLYYPQATPIELGPTEILPGSQYWTCNHLVDDYPKHWRNTIRDGEDRFDIEYFTKRMGHDAPHEVRDQRLEASAKKLDPSMERTPGVFDKGALLVMHPGLVHRLSRRTVDGVRHMLQFRFVRTRAPSQRSSYVIPKSKDSRRQAPLTATFAWHVDIDLPELGEANPEMLKSPLEAERIEAAYKLGSTSLRDGELRSELSEAFVSDKEELRRAGAYGLSVAGPQALPKVEEGLASPDREARLASLYVVARLKQATPNLIEALPTLIRSASDLEVRSTAATSAGYLARASISRGDFDAVRPLVDCLRESLDWTTHPQLPHSIVTIYPLLIAATEALLSIVTEANAQGFSDFVLDESLAAPLVAARQAPCRYSAGFAAKILHRLARYGNSAALDYVLLEAGTNMFFPAHVDEDVVAVDAGS